MCSQICGTAYSRSHLLPDPPCGNYLTQHRLAQNIAILARLKYADSMRSVNIGELKNQLSAYLQFVRNGEEIIVRDRNTPVARILPIRADSLTDHETQLVASGAMSPPLEEINWDAFFAEDTGEDVSEETIAQAVDESRGNW